jgi:hypothetical protein
MNFPKRKKRISDWRRPVGVVGPKSFMAFSDADPTAYAEVHLAGTEQREEQGFVVKEILRTGTWKVTPTRGGVKNVPLTIIRDGKSDRDNNVISLSELVENFSALDMRVQIPLSDDDDDHKNITATNTGYVRDIWIVDSADGSKLVAKMEFTEPDVKDKVLRGTYADVSCGIPWQVVSRGTTYGTSLEHVAITNRPFIDNLGPFIAMSDENRKVEILHFAEQPEVQEKIVEKIVDPFGGLSYKQIMELAESSLPDTLEGFTVEDIKADGIVVKHGDAGLSWLVPFSVEEGKVLPKTEGWTFLKTEGEPKAPEGVPAPPAPSQQKNEKTPEDSGDQLDRELEAARRVRETRMGVAASQTPKKEAHMPLTREELEALNLSELPESQRAVFQKLLNENSDLAATSRETEAERRVTELSNMGFKEKPGALKLYRQVMLGDDGSPAVIVLSDDGKTKQSKTALNILDDFIEAIKGAEGKVVLSDQLVPSGNDIKPPNTPEGEKKPVSERIADAKAALAGTSGA